MVAIFTEEFGCLARGAAHLMIDRRSLPGASGGKFSLLSVKGEKIGFLLSRSGDLQITWAPRVTSREEDAHGRWWFGSITHFARYSGFKRSVTLPRLIACCVVDARPRSIRLGYISESESSYLRGTWVSSYPRICHAPRRSTVMLYRLSQYAWRWGEEAAAG